MLKVTFLLSLLWFMRKKVFSVLLEIPNDLKKLHQVVKAVNIIKQSTAKCTNDEGPWLKMRIGWRGEFRISNLEVQMELGWNFCNNLKSFAIVLVELIFFAIQSK